MIVRAGESRSSFKGMVSRALLPLGALVVVLGSLGGASCAEDTIPDATTAGGSGGTGGSGTAGSGAGTGGATGGGGGASGSTGTGGAGGATGGAGGAGGTGPDGSAGTGGAGGSGGSTGGSAGTGGAGGGKAGAAGSGTGGASGSGTGGAGAGGTGTDGGGAAGSSGGGGAAGAGGAGMPDAAPDAPPRPRDPECDLNGRWLVAQRNLLSLPLGECQAVHTWYYYEVRHEGEGMTITKGLHCGYQAVKKSSQSANVSNPDMWPAMMERMRSDGRTGTFVKQADRCQLTLPAEVVIRGATVAHYRNTANALPMMGSAPAGPNGMPPGHEDWDNDGNPGFSLNINAPLAKGTLYLCTRDTNAINDTAPLSSSLFKIPMTFTTTQSTLGTAAGSNPLITQGGTPFANAASHFTYFQKLQDGQAVGTDAQICEQIRTLKDSLPGDANDVPVSPTCQ